MPILIENVFDDATNKIIIDAVKSQRGWSISNDEYSDKINADLDEYYCDSGMLLRSYSIDQTDYLNNHNANINVLAKLIMEKVLALSNKKYQNVVLQRFLWNYYNRSSNGVVHRDTNSIGVPCESIVYYLNTCDGYTEIEGMKYDSISGNAVIFDSYQLHRGIGPTKSKQRFVLNIMFSYTSVVDL